MKGGKWRTGSLRACARCDGASVDVEADAEGSWMQNAGCRILQKSILVPSPLSPAPILSSQLSLSVLLYLFFFSGLLVGNTDCCWQHNLQEKNGFGQL